jgi:hypothetical protein
MYNKCKKNLIAIALIIVMITCNSITVCASDTWTGNGSTNTYTKGTDEATSADSTNGTSSGTKKVTATYTKAQNSTYSVTITWGSMKYKYDGAIKWNGETYDGDDTTQSWSVTDEANKITVENRSDVKIKADFSFIGSNTYLDKATSNINTQIYEYSDTSKTNPVTALNLGTAADSQSGIRQNSVIVDLIGTPKGIKPVIEDQTVDLENNGITVGSFTVALSEDSDI